MDVGFEGGSCSCCFFSFRYEFVVRGVYKYLNLRWVLFLCVYFLWLVGKRILRVGCGSRDFFRFGYL